MAYTTENFRTKKALKEAVASGRPVEVQANPMGFAASPQRGETTIEGPHFPEPHRWYARVRVEDGFVVKVLS